MLVILEDLFLELVLGSITVVGKSKKIKMPRILQLSAYANTFA